MVCAGAEKGIYDLKEMAFETTESLVRAGESFGCARTLIGMLMCRS